MTQQPDTRLLQGGLDLVSPVITLSPGFCIAALNYESDETGYVRTPGYERFDGRPAPSQATNVAGDTAAARRALIEAVPGSGPVRGVWVYRDAVYAFRDSEDGGSGGMFVSTDSGWSQIPMTDMVLNFIDATVRFTEGLVVTGFTSGATGRIRREVTRSGAYDGTGIGYLVITPLSGTFQIGEVITDSGGGSADLSAIEEIRLSPGGSYEFLNHNFYASEFLERMYFCNGVQTAFEWDGEHLVPIKANIVGGTPDFSAQILGQGDDEIIGEGNDLIIIDTGFDKPVYIAVFADRLVLAFRGGSFQLSSLGEPCEFRPTTGAAEIAVGNAITGVVAGSSTSLIVLCRAKISYLEGTSPENFILKEISRSAGGFPKSAKMLDVPIYLDDGGIRKLQPTQAYGDWKLGSMSELVTPLIERKLHAGVRVATTVIDRNAASYRLFFDDGTGLAMFLGRKRPEVMPFKFRMRPTCSCAGELPSETGVERIFIGAEDGFVYEFNAGNSFDGASVPAFLIVAWNSVNAPRVEKRFFSAALEVDAPDPFSAGVGFQIGFNRAEWVGGQDVLMDICSGTRDADQVDFYDNLLWGDPVSSALEVPIDGMGPNIAIAVWTDTVEEEPHKFQAITVNYKPRKLRR